jgi:hypothetical protein
MNDEEMAKEIAKAAQAFSEPIDFEKLIADGLLTRKGKSYYVPDLKALPENIAKRVKQVVPTKNGLRVTFHKESKSLKKLAGQLSGYLD